MQANPAWRRSLVALLIVLVAGAAARGGETREPEANYLVGRGIADITGPAVGLKMLGYVRPDQLSQGIHLRQWARTFIVAEPDGKRRLAIVTTDLQSVTHALVLSVLDTVRAKLGDTYRVDNVVIAATHTHAVPGGYWQYTADTPVGSPFYQEHFDGLVDGIAASIIAAHEDLRPGRLLINVGEVAGAGAQRSRVAYLQNSEAERSRYRTDIDTDMTLAKFEADGKPIGILNWHAVHPTSMSFNNKLISSDNKGYAEYAFERAQPTGKAPFVAAFAQSNCGDVTPNLNLDATGPGKDEFESTRMIGQRMVDAAQRLFDTAQEKVSGPVDFRHAYVNFANLKVRDEFTKHGDQTTSPSCYGYSFAAGSTEDGGGQPLFREGMTKQELVIESLARAISPVPPPSSGLRLAQKPKPILLALGEAKPPMMPQVLPVGVARIGQLALVIGPAEFTTMSGRRFRESVKQALPDVKYVVVAGYANDYASYVATREEYEVQHYEGASTLYGPWTQAGYQQEFARLAADMSAGRPSETFAAPVDVRGSVRPTPLGTRDDEAPVGAEIGGIVQDAKGAYHPREVVTASFWTGNPQNGYKRDRHYVAIERQEQGQWRSVATDGDWEVKCRFKQQTQEVTAATAPNKTAQSAAPAVKLASGQSKSPFVVTIEWDLPNDLKPGTYRITHHGTFKGEADKPVAEFTGHSRTFVVE